MHTRTCTHMHTRARTHTPTHARSPAHARTRTHARACAHRFNIVLHAAAKRYYEDVMSEEAFVSWHFESQAATWEGYHGVSFEQPRFVVTKV